MMNRGRGEGIISRKVGEEKREGRAEVKQAKTSQGMEREDRGRESIGEKEE